VDERGGDALSGAEGDEAARGAQRADPAGAVALLLEASRAPPAVIRPHAAARPTEPEPRPPHLAERIAMAEARGAGEWSGSATPAQEGQDPASAACSGAPGDCQSTRGAVASRPVERAPERNVQGGAAAGGAGRCQGDASATAAHHVLPAPGTQGARRWLRMTEEGSGACGEDPGLEIAARELQSSILSFLAEAESLPACQTPLRSAGSTVLTPGRAGPTGFLSDRSTILATPGELSRKLMPHAQSHAAAVAA
jgi:hypothetical protein